MLTAVSDQLRAESGSIAAGTCGSWWPWSYRIAGARSPWPAVEVYEADSLLDVVSRTRIAAQLLRGARAVRSADAERAFAWGRLPLSGDVVSVEFSRGRVRKSRRNAAPVVGAAVVGAAVAGATVTRATVLEPTSWCWLAMADGPYDAVTVRCGGVAIRSRLRASRP
jgi:hypothetical protein